MKRHPPEIKLPVGTNPVAKQIGVLMRVYRDSRGWELDAAASTLGITVGHYKYLETGRLVPGPNMSRRLRQWMIDKIDFTGAPTVSEAHWLDDSGRRAWRRVSAIFPKEVATRLKTKARALGMGVQDLAATYIMLGLESKMVYGQIKEAVAAVTQTRNLQALAEAPELRDLLAAEVKILRATPDMTPWQKVAALEPEILKLANSKLSTSAFDPRVDVNEEEEL